MSLGTNLSNLGKGLLIVSVAAAAAEAHRKAEERAAEERYLEYENQRAAEQREYERREAKRKLDEYNNSPEGIAANERESRRIWKIRCDYSQTDECYQLAKEETIRCQEIPVCDSNNYYDRVYGQYFTMPIPGCENLKWSHGLSNKLIPDIIERMENEGIISKAKPGVANKDYYIRKVLVPQKYEDWYACQNDWVKFCEKIDKAWDKFIKWYLN